MGYFFIWQWLCPSKATSLAGQVLPPQLWEQHSLPFALNNCSPLLLVFGISNSCVGSLNSAPPQLIISSLKFLHLYHLSGIPAIKTLTE